MQVVCLSKGTVKAMFDITPYKEFEYTPAIGLHMALMKISTISIKSLSKSNLL